MNYLSQHKKKGEHIALLDIDPWLVPHENDIQLRYHKYLRMLKYIYTEHQSLKNFASGHKFFGIHQTQEGWVYREWAPEATSLALIGDFNQWNRTSHPLIKIGKDTWEIHILRSKFPTFEESLLKVHVTAKNYAQDRIPLYARYVEQNPITHDFKCKPYFSDYSWKNNFKIPKDFTPIIYETHIGMAQEKEGMGTYLEFAKNILPRIHKNGYNTIQIMGIMEHPYYGSFGYQVSNFFAASSRFGTPDDLKYLIDTAHALNIAVFLDIVHSHAVTNTQEGIHMFDGTCHQFFHDGPKGDHPAWGSKVFDYGKLSVQHFLLSNIAFWLEEYHFDGFRFDGVTSMIYHHHGLGHAFDNYGKYFSMDTDTDAILYLQLANTLIQEIREDAITIAEDMSGMPGMCLPCEQGGIGFHYRLNMGVPDMWIRNLKEKADESWSLQEIWRELTGRRPQEKNIGYAESHDQALVGDKTVAFWLMDADMYWFMSKETHNIVIARGIALHKLIRLISFSLSGEGYLNFMGNEFGHPEWIDFPREGNGWSYKYARRQWSLVDNKELKYHYLNDFDEKMIEMSQSNLFKSTPHQLWIEDSRKILVYTKGKYLFIFNFHPYLSVPDFQFPHCPEGTWEIFLNTDAPEFGGFGFIQPQSTYTVENNIMKLYIPARSALVLQRKEPS